MKLKNIIVGDVVKIVPEDAFVRFCEAIGVSEENQKNKFEVRYVDFNPEKPSDVFYVISDPTKPIGENNMYGLHKNRLEVVKGNPTTVSFDDSIGEMLTFNGIGKKILEVLNKCNIRDIEKDYLEFDDNSKLITYIPFDKIKYMNYDFYNEELRKKYAKPIKPIKIIQEILENNKDKTSIILTQDVVDELLACINKEINADFVIVSGKDISKYYNENTYMEQKGTLGNSCMKHAKYEKMGVFYMYEDYAEMVILKDKGTDKIYGRAILWTLHGDTRFEGRKLLDRIYTTNDAFVGMFKQFAYKNKFLCLKTQTYGTYTFLDNDNVVNMDGVDVYVNVDPKINGYMLFPYIDTFYFTFKNHLDRLYHCGFTRGKETGPIVAEYHRTCGVRSVTSEGRDLGMLDGGRTND